MFKISNLNDKDDTYHEMTQSLKAIISDETDWLANISNASALLYNMLPDINWAGFYFYKGEELVLGPFQGKPACIRIPLGKGVCGTAALEKRPVIVPDVHAFPGHIACDEASRSEIVIPIVLENRLIGVLDIDSPDLNRFSDIDCSELQRFIDILNNYIQWPQF